jgi:hypothetical protein
MKLPEIKTSERKGFVAVEWEGLAENIKRADIKMLKYSLYPMS